MEQASWMVTNIVLLFVFSNTVLTQCMEKAIVINQMAPQHLAPIIYSVCWTCLAKPSHA